LNIKRERKERIIESNVNTEPPSIEELIVAINSLKNDKTPGIDQISGDLLKVDAHTSAAILLPLFIRI
jgi:hypothetical protein